MTLLLLGTRKHYSCHPFKINIRRVLRISSLGCHSLPHSRAIATSCASIYYLLSMLNISASTLTFICSTTTTTTTTTINNNNQQQQQQQQQLLATPVATTRMTWLALELLSGREPGRRYSYCHLLAPAATAHVQLAARNHRTQQHKQPTVNQPNHDFSAWNVTTPTLNWPRNRRWKKQKLLVLR